MTVDLNDETSWGTSRSYANLLSPIPDPIVKTVTALWRSQAQGDNDTGGTTLRWIEKTPKLKGPLILAAQALVPGRIEEGQKIEDSKVILEILGPGLFAALLSLVYLHKRLGKLCSAPEWSATVSKEFVLNMELGFLIGTSMPRLGAPLGTLIGGIRYAGLATFLIRNSDQFLKYRNLKKKKFDLEYEHTYWGCDHAQVGASLISDMGMRKDVFEVAKALRMLGTSPNDISQELRVWNAGVHWIDAVKDGKAAPENSEHAAILGLSQEDRATLKAKTDALFKGSSSFTWMLRSPTMEKGDEVSA